MIFALDEAIPMPDRKSPKNVKKKTGYKARQWVFGVKNIENMRFVSNAFIE